jgi:hypothetical protein
MLPVFSGVEQTDIVAGSIAFNRVPVLGRVYQRAVRSRRELVQLLKSLVLDRRRQNTEDMMGQLCRSMDEEGWHLSDAEIIDQMIFIMMAAHDTTASTWVSDSSRCWRAGSGTHQKQKFSGDGCGVEQERGEKPIAPHKERNCVARSTAQPVGPNAYSATSLARALSLY